MNTDADIKVYPLPAVEEKVQMNGWQLAAFVVLGLVVGAVLFLLGVRT